MVETLAESWSKEVVEKTKAGLASTLKVDAKLDVFEAASSRKLVGKNIQRLLIIDQNWWNLGAAMGMSAGDPLACVEPSDEEIVYPWRQRHCFELEQDPSLSDTAAEVLRMITGVFTKLPASTQEALAKIDVEDMLISAARGGACETEAEAFEETKLPPHVEGESQVEEEELDMGDGIFIRVCL